jgi:hypothetical protein
MGRGDFAEFPRGCGGRLAPTFLPDFLTAVAHRRARNRPQRSPLAAIARLKFGRILGTAKGRSEVEEETPTP